MPALQLAANTGHDTNANLRMFSQLGSDVVQAMRSSSSLSDTGMANSSGVGQYVSALCHYAPRVGPGPREALSLLKDCRHTQAKSRPSRD